MTSLMSLHIKCEKTRWWSLKNRKCVPEAFSITGQTKRWASETHGTAAAAAHEKHSNTGVATKAFSSTLFLSQSSTCCQFSRLLLNCLRCIISLYGYTHHSPERPGWRRRAREDHSSPRRPYAGPRRRCSGQVMLMQRDAWGKKPLLGTLYRPQVIIPFCLSTQPKTIRILSALPGKHIRSY